MADRPLVEDFHPNTVAHRRFADPIVFWDETLRDGEQMPGVWFSPDEKLRIAEKLSEVGVPVINAGLPVVSEEESRAVRHLVDAGLKSKILGTARARAGDVDAVIRTGAPLIAIFVAASQVHLRYKLKMTEEEVVRTSVETVSQAKAAGLHVAFVTEDTVRAPFDFVERLYRAVVEAGADRLVISDTVGIMTPLTFRWYLAEFERRIHPKDWAVHCHNDFGLAVANTLTALEAGVTSPHVCVNGIGERSGNASLEELAVTLEAIYGVRTGLRTEKIYELSRLVEELSGVPIAANKALVGYNSFSHEAGIHTHGILAHTLTYEPLQPERVGRRRQMIFGKHTGRAAIVEKLKERGAEASEEAITNLLHRIKRGTEEQSKEALREFLKSYRSQFEHPGISDEEFWRLARESGVRWREP